MSDLSAFIILLGSCLTCAWMIALLVGVWRVREALVDEEFPAEDMALDGMAYRVALVRVRGRFGATYQRKDGEPKVLEPRFKDRGAVMVHVRSILSAR